MAGCGGSGNGPADAMSVIVDGALRVVDGRPVDAPALVPDAAEQRLTAGVRSPRGMVELFWSGAPAGTTAFVVMAGTDETALETVATLPASAATFGDAAAGDAVRLYRVEALAGAKVAARSDLLTTATLPTTTIAPLPGDAWRGSNDATINVMGADDGAIVGIDWQLDDADWRAGAAGPVSLGNLRAGSHVFRARARDDLGNLDPTLASYIFALEVDFAASIEVAGGAPATSSRDVELALHAMDAVSMEVGEAGDLSDAMSQPFAAALSWTLSDGDGDKRPYARFTDDAGNVSEIVSDGIRLDTAGPVVAITAPAEGELLGDSVVSVAGTVEDPSGVASVTVAGVAATVEAGTFRASVSLVDGPAVVIAEAEDALGNHGVSVARSIRVDTTPPALTVLSPSGHFMTRADAIDVHGLASDATAVTVTANGVAAATGDGQFTAFGVPIAEGDNVVTVSAVDEAGHTTTRTLNVTRDQKPPRDPVVTTVGPDPVSGMAICGIAEAGSTVLVKVGEWSGQVVADADGGFCKTVPSADEVMTAYVTSVDAAGNASGTVAAALDTTAPGRATVGPIVSPTRRRAIILYGFAEPGSRVVVRGGAEEAASAARSDTGFFFVGVKLRLNNTNELEVRARDVLGNEGEATVVEVRQREAQPMPDRLVLVSSGDGQRALTGEAVVAPLAVLVVDALRQPIPDVPVKFQVVGGGGSVDGSAEADLVSGPDGSAQASLVLGDATEPAGNLVLVDIDGNQGPPVLFTATGFAPNPGGATSVSGLVLGDQLEPIVGAMVLMDGDFALTDDEGAFELLGVAPGTRKHFFVNPASASGPKSYPPMTHVIDVLPGQNNTIGRPIFLPDVDIASKAQVSEDAGGVARSSLVADLEVALAPGQVTFSDGSKVGQVFVSPVPANRVPMPLTSGFGSSGVISVLPTGAVFDPPASVTFPNVDGLPAGSPALLLSFDHNLGRYKIVGTSTVSDDGKVVSSDPGSGIRKGAWHGNVSPFPPPGTTAEGECPNNGKCNVHTASGPAASGPFHRAVESDPNATIGVPAPKNKCPSKSPDPLCGASTAGEPVSLHSGELVQSETDLAIAGRGFDFAFVRTYRSHSANETGPLGAGWYHPYQIRLIGFEEACTVMGPGGSSVVAQPGERYRMANVPLGPTAASMRTEAVCVTTVPPGQPLVRITGAGSAETFAPQPDGTYLGEDGVLARLRPVDGAGVVRFTLEARGGQVEEYDASGRLLRQKDRFGNTMSFWWDERERLARVVDTLGRVVRFTHDAEDRIVRVEDWTGRRVDYQYDAHNDLVAVTGPALSTEVESPPTRYAYDHDSPYPELRHNLLTVTDPLGNVALTSTYGVVPGSTAFDRVVAQTWGGGTATFEYVTLHDPADVPPGTAVSLTRYRDRNGNLREYLHDAAGHEVEVRAYTNRGIQPGAPPVYVLTRQFTDGLLRKVTFPRGSSIEYRYDEDNPEPLARGNLIEERRSAGSLPGGELITRYTYEPRFGQVATIADARAFHPDYGPEDKYVTRYTYDDSGMLVRVDAPDVTRDDGSVLPISWRFEHDRYGQRTRMIDPDGNVTTYAYHPATDPDGDGRANARPGLDAITGGYLAEVVNDADGGPDRSSTIPPVAARTTFAYDAVGRPIARTDPLGNTWRSEFDARGHELRRIDPLGFAVTSRLDARGDEIERRTDVSGGDNDADFPGGAIVLRMTWDAARRQIAVEHQVSGVVFARASSVWDANGNVVRGTSAAGVITELTYDERDLVVRRRTAPGTAAEETTTSWYDEGGNLVAEANGLGERTTYEYDGLGRNVRMCRPSGVCQRFVYDPLGALVAQRAEAVATDGAAPKVLSEVRFERDEAGNVRRRSELLVGEAGKPDAWATTVYRRDALGSIVHVKWDNGRSFDFVTDGLGRAEEARETGGATLTSDFDAVGHVVRTRVTETTADSDVSRTLETTYAYDARGLLVAVHDPMTGPVAFAHDAAGRVIAATDGRGTTRHVTVDGRGLPIKLRSDAGGRASPELGSLADGMSEWTWSYDLDGRVTAVVDPVGQARSFAYDEAGRLTRTTYADGSTTSVAFDAAGRVATAMQADGTVMTFLRDVEGRPLRMGASAAADAVDFAYDVLGRVTAVSRGGHVVERSWDSLGRMVAEAEDGEVVRMDYDLEGHLTGLVYPDGSVVDFGFDAQGRLVVFSGEAVGGSITSEPIGIAGEVRREYPNGLVATWARDEQGRVAGVRQHIGTTDISSEEYTLGPGNEVLAVRRTHEGGKGDAYGYDGAGRLAEATIGVADPELALIDPEAAVADKRWRFRFDDASQLRGFDEDAAAHVIEVGRDGEIDRVDAVVRSFDARGNLATAGERTFAHDAFGQLASVGAEGAALPVATYEHDGLGRLRARVAGGLSLRYLYAGDALVAIEDGDSGELLWKLVPGPNGLVAAQSRGQTYYPLVNRSADIIGWTSADGAVVERTSLSPYGEPEITNGGGTPVAPLIPTPPVLNGQLWDPAVGLYTLGARSYDPALGSFLERDPAAGVIGSGGALYQYALGDPVNFGDPFGLTPEPRVPGDYDLQERMRELFRLAAWVSLNVRTNDYFPNYTKGKSMFEIFNFYKEAPPVDYEAGRVGGATQGVVERYAHNLYQQQYQTDSVINPRVVGRTTLNKDGVSVLNGNAIVVLTPDDIVDAGNLVLNSSLGNCGEKAAALYSLIARDSYLEGWGVAFARGNGHGWVEVTDPFGQRYRIDPWAGEAWPRKMQRDGFGDAKITDTIYKARWMVQWSASTKSCPVTASHPAGWDVGKDPFWVSLAARDIPLPSREGSGR